ncbi:alpha/beta hydrolase [Streptomyces decoyicus]|uniref:Alpha/beta hydrolase n=1 Tax=Streptomyces decoyicus TaxID=249567 RepID=A0ABZ1FDE7_9ACTN|nr:alpha/beta fold hydrolase [Streptomyces decoyicus]WSB68196.1 alpha/beta hydrolase [Streptomyces decoyicus]
MWPVEVLEAGEGPPAVLVHGHVVSARPTWAAQQSLADRYRLRLVNRRGYGQSRGTEAEDFAADAEDVVEVLGDGAHLVGHSYGGVVALLAAARRPERVRSLTVIEPPVFSLLPERPEVWEFIADYEALTADGMSPEDFLPRFLVMLGTPQESVPGSLPRLLPQVLRRAVITQMRGRRPWDAQIALDTLARGPFPRLVVSGGHSALFEGVCEALAHGIRAEHSVLPGYGHAVQRLGRPFNDALSKLWTRADAVVTQPEAVTHAAAPQLGSG